MTDEQRADAYLVEDAVARAQVDQGSREIDVRIMRYGEVATRTQEGYAEAFADGSIPADMDPSRIVLESTHHGGAIVGVARRLVQRGLDMIATFRVATTQAGDELLTLVREGVIQDASVVFAPIKHRVRPDGVVERQSVELRRVALLPRGAYPSARVLAFRSHPQEVRSMPDGLDIKLTGTATPTQSQEAPTEAPPAPEAPRSEAQVELARTAPSAPGIDPARVDQLEARLAVIESSPAGASRPASVLAPYATLADYAAEVWRGAADSGLMAQELARVAADQITDNNPGVVPPAWLQDVKRIVDLGRRAITAFGGAQALPASGMELDWPYLSSSNTLIAEQPTGEKNEVQSARVDIAKGSSSLVTYAGYSDISYQLLQRSSPAYRNAYDRIMLAAWGSVTDAAFCAALEGATGTTTQAARGMLGADKTLSTSAASDDIIDCTSHGFSIGDAVVFTALTGGTGLTAGRVYWVVATSYGTNTFRVSDAPGGAAVGFTADITAGTVAKITDTGQRLHEALAQASVSVEDATGQPAGIALAGTDMFLALAGLSGIVPYAPSNAPGMMMASTLRVEVSGLTIARAPGVSNGKLLVSNREAAAWHEDGPRFVSAEDVAKLGQNVGVYSFSAAAVYAPAGVVELTLI